MCWTYKDPCLFQDNVPYSSDDFIIIVHSEKKEEINKIHKVGLQPRVNISLASKNLPQPFQKIHALCYPETFISNERAEKRTVEKTVVVILRLS